MLFSNTKVSLWPCFEKISSYFETLSWIITFILSYIMTKFARNVKLPCESKNLILKLTLPLAEFFSFTNFTSAVSWILIWICQLLVSSPIVAHCLRIRNGSPCSVLASQTALPLLTEKIILSCSRISFIISSMCSIRSRKYLAVPNPYQPPIEPILRGKSCQNIARYSKNLYLLLCFCLVYAKNWNITDWLCRQQFLRLSSWQQIMHLRILRLTHSILHPSHSDTDCSWLKFQKYLM